MRTAARFGADSVVNELLGTEYGRQEILESKDSSSGRTALHFAAEAGQQQVTQVLPDYGEYLCLLKTLLVY